MKYLRDLLLLLSIMINYASIHVYVNYYKELDNKLIYDVDKLHEDYVLNLRGWYQRACVTGSGYPTEYKNTTGFNPNSAINWCETQREEFNDIFNKESLKLGRKDSAE